MLHLAKERGDAKSDDIVGVLIGMMDYQQWISSIFTLKQNSRVAGLLAGAPPPEAVQEQPQPQPQMLNVEVPQGVLPGQQLQVMSPDGQALLVTVPEGLAPGQQF